MESAQAAQARFMSPTLATTAYALWQRMAQLTRSLGRWKALEVAVMAALRRLPRCRSLADALSVRLATCTSQIHAITAYAWCML